MLEATVEGLLGKDLFAVVIVDRDGVDRTGPGRELRVQFGVVWDLPNKHVLDRSSRTASTALPASTSRSNVSHSSTHWNIPMQVSRS